MTMMVPVLGTIILLGSKMSPQEYVDFVYDEVVKWLDRATQAVEQQCDAGAAISYGAAHASWDELNKVIKKTGQLPTAWKTSTYEETSV